MAASLKEAFRVRVELSGMMDVGPVPGGYRRIFPIVGGTFEGPRIKAKLFPIGADWNLVQPDGMMFVSARYCMQTDDGAIISVLNEGYGRLDEEAQELIKTMGMPNPDTWYSKTQPRFEVSDPKYDWLTKSVFVMDHQPPKDPNIVELIGYEIV